MNVQNGYYKNAFQIFKKLIKIMKKMECAICIEPMNTEKFIAIENGEDQIDENDSSCVRLKCGHAFHICCSIGSFRSGLLCPSCREAVPQQEFEIFLLEDTVISEDTMTQNVDTIRSTQRIKDCKVREARRKLNKSKKTYNILCEKLRNERKQIIKKVLRDFRLQRHSEYLEVYKDVQKTLKDVKKAEMQSLIKTGLSEDHVNAFIDDSRGFEYDITEYVKCKDENALDPSLKQFWR